MAILCVNRTSYYACGIHSTVHRRNLGLPKSIRNVSTRLQHRPLNVVGQQQQAASVTGATQKPSKLLQEKKPGTEYEFCCPICFSSKLTVTKDAYRTSNSLSCPRCSRTYEDVGPYVDLTLTSGLRSTVYQPKPAPSQDLFRSPVVSFVYERGWRQSFRGAGFPGPDKEFDMAMQFLAPAYGESMMDLSCGSGLFTRRFIKSKKFSTVVAADFSESMLRQTQQFIADDATISNSDYCLVRADVARMPFAGGTLAGIHAGAAIHCWPDPQAAMAEISRVLRPGGVFVGTTFMTALAPVGQIFGDDVVRPISQRLDGVTSSYKWWDEGELRDLAARVGLVDFQRDRSNRYIMFTMRKPAAN